MEKTLKNKIIRLFSAGGVIFKKEKNKIKIVLLKKDDGKWVLPKGTIEKGETYQETALREVSEETGLKKLQIIDELEKENYFFRRKWEDNKLVYKTVFYFLMKSLDDEKPIPQKEEGFIDVRWFPIDKAEEISSFKESKKIIKLAKQRILNEGF